MNVLISRCLLGVNCRYDGKNNKIQNLREKFPQINFIDVCPEVDSGMKTPRKPCEIKNSKVINIDGEDFTKEFKKGSQISLDLCKKYNIKIDGINCQVLKKNGIIIYSEK